MPTDPSPAPVSAGAQPPDAAADPTAPRPPAPTPGCATTAARPVPTPGPGLAPPAPAPVPTPGPGLAPPAPAPVPAPGPGLAPPAPGLATPVPAPRRHRRVVRTGTETTDVSGLAQDERGGHGENDERLLRDLPPHWGKR